MDKRFFLALALTVVVVLLMPRLFPRPPGPVQPSTVDSLKRQLLEMPTLPPDTAVAVTIPTSPDRVVGSSAISSVGDSSVTSAVPIGDTVVVSTSKALYRFSTVGGVLLDAQLQQYQVLPAKTSQVELARQGESLLELAELAIGQDTIALGRVSFSVDSAKGTGSGQAPLTFHADVKGVQVTLKYTFVPGSYLVHLDGEVQAPGGVSTHAGAVTFRFPNGLHSGEADTTDDVRHLSYVAKPLDATAKSIDFGKVDPGKQLTVAGPLGWVASKNKYFLFALLRDTTKQPLDTLVVTGGQRVGKLAPNAEASFSQQLTSGGQFGVEIYAGPQEWKRLRAIGRDLDHVNPYGGYLRGVVEPFASLVMWVVLGLHDALRIGYGWILVVIGVGVRLILWPLNQRAMRSSLKMQRIQPELQAVQKKYAKQQEKQHAEMMRVYKEHGMSPFSMFSGCLPMLIPMPVLFALYFVFQNTIEFRGVSFLWLADLSQKDPYYILPIVMGLSMFLLSWIGMRNVPPNAQTKMMAYVMPATMTFIFLNFASGLNLYYAVQNVAALPQQWLISNERAKATPPRVISPAKSAKT